VQPEVAPQGGDDARPGVSGAAAMPASTAGPAWAERRGPWAADARRQAMLPTRGPPKRAPQAKTVWQLAAPPAPPGQQPVAAWTPQEQPAARVAGRPVPERPAPGRPALRGEAGEPAPGGAPVAQPQVASPLREAWPAGPQARAAEPVARPQVPPRPGPTVPVHETVPAATGAGPPEREAPEVERASLAPVPAATVPPATVRARSGR
jgi:hypothetical protein